MQGKAIAGHPLLTIDELLVIRGDEGYPAVPRVQQVLTGGGDARLVVEPDAALLAARHLTIDEDDGGGARRQLAQLLVRQRLAVQDQGVTLALQQRLDGVTLPGRVVVAGDHYGELVRLVDHALDATHHLGEEGATTEIPNQDTDAVGTFAYQGLGEAVWTKTQLLHGREHGLALLGCNLRRVVDDSRHRRNGHIRQLRYVFDRCHSQFLCWGSLSVLIGHYIEPVRPRRGARSPDRFPFVTKLKG